MDRNGPAPETPAEVVRHYGRFDESQRLSDGFGLLERLRTEQIIDRELPPPPAVVVDVGSGPGVYATWLALREYEVHAVDPVPHHVFQAEERAAAHSTSLASAIVGDARRIELPSGIADAVLLMGPLYHLQERPDRLLALSEAHRLLRPGGFVAAAAINRYASAIDGLTSGYVDDPRFADVLQHALETGRHTNPTEEPGYFTTAYFHHAADLEQELADADFASIDVQAVEGIAWLAPDFADRLADTHRRAQLLELTDRLSREPSLMGVSPHLMAIGHR